MRSSLPRVFRMSIVPVKVGRAVGSADITAKNLNPEISIKLRITRLQSFRVSFPMCKNKYEIHSSQGPKRHVHKLIVVRHCYVEEIILICIFHSFDHIKTIHQIYTYIDHHHHSCLTLLRQGLLPCPRAIFICALW